MAFPVLSTDCLLLREMRAQDSSGYAALLTDPSEAYFITDSPVSPASVAARIENNRLAFEQGRAAYWSVTREGAFVGFVALHAPTTPSPALSYAISRPWRRRHLAAEALSAVCHFAFRQLAAHSLLASTHLENLASARLLHFLQFSDEGIFESPNGPRRRFRLQKP